MIASAFTPEPTSTGIRFGNRVIGYSVAVRQMMSEAEPRGTRWYHPKMGLFQAIGWEG